MQLEPHFFRREFGKLVAALTRRVGCQHLQSVEDAVQSALVAALEIWPREAVPQDPSAWLYRVARNAFTDEVRRAARRKVLLTQQEEPRGATADGSPYEAHDYNGGAAFFSWRPFLAGEVQDDLLRMLFTCCSEELPVESQLVLALRTLCGFDVREISLRLFLSEANVYKKLTRARQRLRRQPASQLVNAFDKLDARAFSQRLPTVHKILHLLFTEGCHSSHAKLAIRKELCDDALRLNGLLLHHPVGKTPETCALMALMCLHTARLNGRQDAGGSLVLLEYQDRSLWDQNQIRTGIEWLAQSATGEKLSRYHLEAHIAAEHCLAPSFTTTRWDKIVESYQLLESIAPSPLHRLNRAVATAEWKDPVAGLEVLQGYAPPAWLEESYQWSAALADLNSRTGNLAGALRYQEAALASAPTAAIRELLLRRLQ